MTVRLEDMGSYLVVHNRDDKRGAISPAFYQTIVKAIEMARATRIRCVILTGGAFFCAGGDLKALRTRAELPAEDRRAKVELLHDVSRAMHGSDVPLIAAVEGAVPQGPGCHWPWPVIWSWPPRARCSPRPM